MRPHHLAPLTASLLALAVAGCGISNPYQHTTRAKTTPPTTPPTTSASTAATTTGPTAALDATSPQTALQSYAHADINWTSRTLGAQQRTLASRSLGSARSAALQAAATYGAGSQLQRSSVTNSGQVTSVAAGQGPLAGQWVITTREKTAGAGDYQGLPAQAHVYYARLQHTATGWEVSQWSPQN